jgi:hypothetical protein
VADMQVGRGIVNGGGNVVITLTCVAHICKSSCGINCDIPNHYSPIREDLSTDNHKKAFRAEKARKGGSGYFSGNRNLRFTLPLLRA